MSDKEIPQDLIGRATALSRDDAERLFSRMRGKLRRRMERGELTPVGAIALQLLYEDEALAEWRRRVAELRA